MSQPPKSFCPSFLGIARFPGIARFLRSTEWQQGPEFIKDLENFPEAVFEEALHNAAGHQGLAPGLVAGQVVQEEEEHGG